MAPRAVPSSAVGPSSPGHWKPARMSAVALSVPVPASPPKVGPSSDPWPAAVSAVGTSSVPTVSVVIDVDGALSPVGVADPSTVGMRLASLRAGSSSMLALAPRSVLSSVELVASPKLWTSSLFDFVKVRKVFDFYDVGRNYQRVVDLEDKPVGFRAELTALISALSSLDV